MDLKMLTYPPATLDRNLLLDNLANASKVPSTRPPAADITVNSIVNANPLINCGSAFNTTLESNSMLI